MPKFTVACVQHCATDQRKANIETLTALTRRAQQTGAQVICLPEVCTATYPTSQDALREAIIEADNEELQSLRQLAAEIQTWLSVGSIMVWDEKSSKTDDAKLRNRSFLLSPTGEITARYDKIHVFDASVGDNENYGESAYVQAGTDPVVADIPFVKLGLTICYDVRFPALYRYLAQQGAQCLTVPSAFTVPTGRAHWHVLLRARAIETGCFIIAPAQCGVRPWGRTTYGHSLIVNPWGEILADAGEEEGIICADIDLSLVDEVRRQIPSLRNNAFVPSQ